VKDLVKLAVAELAQAGFRNGESLATSNAYDITVISPLVMQVRVSVEGNLPRYFNVTVSEKF
jgi:hypothetical protein